MQAMPGPVSPSFPNTGQAVLLGIGVILAQVAGAGLLAILSEITGAPAGIESLFNPWSLGAINVLAIGAAIAWGLRATREAPRPFFTIRPFAPALLPAIVTTTLGLALVLSETDNIIGELLRLLPGFQDYSHLLKLREYPLGAFLLLVIIAPLTEEYLFRGLMLRGLLTRQSPAVAVGITALLFGLVHANLPQLFLGVVIGAVFGWWYVRTGSLGPCLIGHAVFNGVACVAIQHPDSFSALGFTVPGHPVVHHPWWLTAGGVALTGIGLAWFKSATDSRALAPSPAETEPPLLPVAAPVPEPPPAPIP
jgi:membrane protease YdiL (CAAX protease family)